MNKTQYPKLITDIPGMDIVIKMGCNVVCPYLSSKYEEDWGLDDPTGQDEDAFKKTALTIKEKIKDLAQKIKNNKINI